MIHHFKTGILTHSLDLADHLKHKAFLNQLGSQVCIQHNGYIVVSFGNKAFLLCHIDQKILLSQGDLASIYGKPDGSFLLQLLHGLCSVYLLQVLFNASKLLSILRPHGAELRLKAVACEIADIVLKYHILHIQLFLDNILKVVAERMCSLYIHHANGLAVLYIGGISGSTAHYNNIKGLFHVLFKLFIDPFLFGNREVTKVDAFRSILIHTAYHVLIDFLCHERNHGRRTLTDFYKGSVKRHISVDLILLHALSPETFTAPAHIPVAHFVYKIIKNPCCLRDPVIFKMIVYLCDRRI